MMTRILAATATLATALAVSTGAQAGSYGYVYPAPAPVIVHAPVVAPSVGPLYFKRDYHGAHLVVKQCRQHRVLDSWGNIAYQEHCQ